MRGLGADCRVAFSAKWPPNWLRLHLLGLTRAPNCIHYKWADAGRLIFGRAKGLPVEYRGIRYTIRARIERNEWTVSIHPAGIEGARRVVTGPRERAELLARSMIDRWRAAKRTESSA